jgi:aerobic C4-dicarboxylate transport protein
MKTTFYNRLYIQVLAGIAAGILTGMYFPDTAVKLKPLGDYFIQLIKMLTGPIIFITIVTGIAGMNDLKKVGRIGAKSLLYFEIVTTVALLTGLIVMNVLRPGDGMNISLASLDTAELGNLQSKEPSSFADKIIPADLISPFIKASILQVLFLALLTGFALSSMKEHASRIISVFETTAKVLFKMLAILLRAAPIAAFGAMAFTVGKYGTESLIQLASLMAAVYITCIIFVIIVLGSIARAAGFSLFKYIYYIREEILLVLGTSSSESAMPSLMEKIEKAGCSRSATGIIIPAGYSFNLDGTSIYLTMAALFIAQATNTPMTWYDQLALLGILMLTSKGAAAISGGGLITLAATLTSMDLIPAGGIALIIGIDRFMSEARAITNLIGNGVAAIVISKWDKEYDEEKGRFLKS